MPELSFVVTGVESRPLEATPQLGFQLHISNAHPDEEIHTVILNCQLRLDPTKRTYNEEEQRKLHDLFGEPSRWGHTLKSLMWTHSTITVPAFTDSIDVVLPAQCSFDFNIGATKYFYALEDGELPVVLLFSGTIFYQSPSGLLVSQIPWNQESSIRVPVATWQEMMDHYYPNTAWFCLRRDVFDRLASYKSDQAIPTWEQVMESLLNQEK